MIKILVAEDEPVARDFLDYILQQEGYTPLLAADGDMAMMLARNEQPDLILLDVMMPYVDGFEVLRRLKEAPDLKRIPVIMLTARTSDADVNVGFDIGATDYVEKPFSIAKLLARVRHALQETGALNKPVTEDPSDAELPPEERFLEKRTDEEPPPP
jgi:DNA-binding response OmpR family regulator